MEGKSIWSFHDHSGAPQVKGVIEKAKTQEVVFVSDAGSPLISDPAFPLVREALKQEIDIASIGGISSVICALELSGLPSTPFHFHGFLARDKGKVKSELQEISTQYGTHIFFEGKSRVLQTLKEVSVLFPEFEIALCRELTKEFETVHRFMGKDFEKEQENIVVKGEFVILVNNPNKNQTSRISSEMAELAENILDNGARPKKLAKLLSLITAKNSKDIYDLLISTRQ